MRKLALVRTFACPGLGQPFVETEPCWREIYKHNGNWEFWCGKVGTVSTDKPDIIRMIDCPE